MSPAGPVARRLSPSQERGAVLGPVAGGGTCHGSPGLRTGVELASSRRLGRRAGCRCCSGMRSRCVRDRPRATGRHLPRGVARTRRGRGVPRRRAESADACGDFLCSLCASEWSTPTEDSGRAGGQRRHTPCRRSATQVNGAGLTQVTPGGGGPTEWRRRSDGVVDLRAWPATSGRPVAAAGPSRAPRRPQAPGLARHGAGRVSPVLPRVATVGLHVFRAAAAAARGGLPRGTRGWA